MTEQTQFSAINTATGAPLVYRDERVIGARSFVENMIIKLVSEPNRPAFQLVEELPAPARKEDR